MTPIKHVYIEAKKKNKKEKKKEKYRVVTSVDDPFLKSLNPPQY